MKKLGIFVSVLSLCLSLSVAVLAAAKDDTVINGVHTNNTPLVSAISGQDIEINKSIENINSPEYIDVKLTLKSDMPIVPKTGDSGIGFLIIIMASSGAAIVALHRKGAVKAAPAVLLVFSIFGTAASIAPAAYAQSAQPSYMITESFADETQQIFTFDRFILSSGSTRTIKDDGGRVTGITWIADGATAEQSIIYRLVTNESIPDELYDKEICISIATLAFTDRQGNETDMRYPDVSVMLTQTLTLEPEEPPLGELPEEPTIPPVTEPTVPPTVEPTNPPTEPTIPPIVQVTLTYSANGGTGDDIVLSVPSGVIATIASNMFERTGYTFRSWNTQPDESGEAYMPGDTLTLTGDVTLYAQWESAPVNLVYDINNPYHRDYTGVINTTESEAVPPGPYSVKSLGSIFPEYTGECEFMWWSTAPDGTGTAHLPGSVLTVEDDVNLYAIWKSCKPIVSQIYEYDITISGSGVVGAGDIGSTIWVTLPDGTTVSTTVLSNGTWTVNVPPVILAYMTAGTQIRVTQIEPGIGKLASDWVVATILF